MAQNGKILGKNIARCEPVAKAPRPTPVWYVTTQAGRPALAMLWFPELPSES